MSKRTRFSVSSWLHLPRKKTIFHEFSNSHPLIAMADLEYIFNEMKTPEFTILVAEDNRDDRLFIERAFRKAGVKGPIQLVHDGEEAIAYLNGDGKFADREEFQYPTFIVMDLKMPKVNGLEVLENLKKNPLWAVIPTVILSASSDQDDIKKAYLLGASAYHVKPIRSEDLQNQLRILYDYWMTCEVPQVDTTGRQLPTKSEGKLGEKFPAPSSEDNAQNKSRDESC